MLVGVSSTTVETLVRNGTLIKGSPADDWIKAYFLKLRESAAGRGKGGGELDLVEERAKVAYQQAEKLEMENAVTRGELVDVQVLGVALSRVGKEVASILDSLPVKLKRQSKNLSAHDIDLIRDAIAEARNTAADIQLKDVDIE